MRTFLFDLYDTLVFTDWARVIGHVTGALGVDGERLARAYGETRIPRGLGRFGSAAGDLQAVAATVGVPLAPERAAALAVEIVDLMKTHVRPYDDAWATLRALRAGGARLAVISNCDFATRPVVDHLGLAAEVDAVVLSFEVGLIKPDADIFIHTLAQLDSSPEQSLFVDDQPRYLSGAHALGMAVRQIVRGPLAGPPGPYPVIDSLSALAAGQALPSPGNSTSTSQSR